jgi:Family of unknown function (DUF5995)
MGRDQLTGIPGVLARMDALLAAIPADLTTQRTFLSTYRRTTIAVGDQVEQGRFEDPAWVDRWDVVFADLYVSALEAHLAGGHVPRPWRLAFAAPEDLPVLRLLLLGINAHINYDLPQALLAVISPEDFAKPALLARRQRDHERIDAILAGRVSAENAQLLAASRRNTLDRVLRPLNQAGSKRFLREARQKVWHNTRELHEARLAGPEIYVARLAELEVLSAAKVADLLAPGQVVLKLTVAGFGVTLPPPA